MSPRITQRVDLGNGDHIGRDFEIPAGVPLVRRFPFAFNTPGILTGAVIYTPTVGDILLDAWIEIVDPWDGTTPLGDVGGFGGTRGWFAYAAQSAGLSGAIDMTFFDLAPNSGGLIISGSNQGPGCNAPLSAYNTVAGPTKLDRWVPGWFTGDPIKVVVSQDGLLGGSAPGSTQGAALLYLVTATPV